MAWQGLQAVTMRYNHQEMPKEGKTGWGRIQPHGVGWANGVNSEDKAGSLSLAHPLKSPPLLPHIPQSLPCLPPGPRSSTWSLGLLGFCNSMTSNLLPLREDLLCPFLCHPPYRPYYLMYLSPWEYKPSLFLQV